MSNSKEWHRHDNGDWHRLKEDSEVYSHEDEFYEIELGNPEARWHKEWGRIID